MLKRGFLLATFAIVLQHFRPTVISPESNSEKWQLALRGIYGLILGLAFEPYQGGIKKDPATMSYFFITTAIAIFILRIILYYNCSTICEFMYKIKIILENLI
ncbi:hypothetical protein LJE16_10505 [Planktothrix agardhii 1810]|nr:hypothetical protein [Planktothrix agardhii]MCB8751125.1 hypothetical protein [Planktothrix agardhii 1810]MDS1346256.1 hypothetical protein [Planktothrix agardhii NRERC-751]MEA5561181.1 hypothetical protein [Planktothrix agardhii UHCC 0887]